MHVARMEALGEAVPPTFLAVDQRVHDLQCLEAGAIS